VWQRTAAFAKKAGSIIVILSVIVWALSALPEGNIQSSYLGRIGQFLVPLGAWMGLSWQMTVALLTSFVAKENTIATLGILYGAGQEGVGLGAALAGALTPPAALAFLSVQMLFVPCAATVAAIKQETGTWKWTLFDIGLMLGVALSVGVAIYQVAKLLYAG
jgi:ferrous iron transport protein B